jgi:F-box protein 21
LRYDSVCDKSVRYVAEENIEPVSNDTEPSEAMMRLAGRHFKRWDNDARLFVSNVRDEYPDD